ncbi:hypothetical protein HFO07_29480 [Rhizobium leguminosarum]|uniref:hypothetical protein n=1 Tax=Rhizobium leguminosarum TaxID=384 RepID=UPI001C946C02|nr:hypothetical protein [Rhizobium leguminosarum]MBY5760729.1 hypothetical protein [Rhizobium leguminosarum]
MAQGTENRNDVILLIDCTSKGTPLKQVLVADDDAAMRHLHPGAVAQAEFLLAG